jgi:AcrR family transcriptional regulator
VSSDGGSNARVRRTLGGSNDPRVARTRDAIADAVHRLSDRDGDLTVSSIVRESGVSRASFYAHYSGLDELAAHLMRDAFQIIAADYEASVLAPADAMRASQTRLVDHFLDNLAFYRAVSELPVSKDGYLAAVRAMAAFIEPALAAHPEAHNPPAVARYVAGAAYGLIDAWLTGDVDLGPEELVDHLTSLLPPWFSGVR